MFDIENPCADCVIKRKNKKFYLLFKDKIYIYINFIILFYLVLFYFILFALHCIILHMQILCIA